MEELFWAGPIDQIPEDVQEIVGLRSDGSVSNPMFCSWTSEPGVKGQADWIHFEIVDPE